MFDWKWSLNDIVQDKPVKVFSLFSCGGGSTMGYKRAGFEVLGNVEIDPKINKTYINNFHPKYNYNMDVRKFVALSEFPAELKNLDILDGSPPCTTFSVSGKREKTWGKKKKFTEGQAEQRLDDLFFEFIKAVERLMPKIFIAENVSGLILGNAKVYVQRIMNRFKALGYDTTIYQLNSATMDVPQARKRVFFIGNRIGLPKLDLSFNNRSIPFGECRSESGKPINGDCYLKLLSMVKPSDHGLDDIYKRVTGKSSFFNYRIVHDSEVCPTFCAGTRLIRFYDKMWLSDEDIKAVSTFPVNYDPGESKLQFLCGMCVPPNMIANIATRIWEQWLGKI